MAVPSEFAEKTYTTGTQKGAVALFCEPCFVLVYWIANIV